MVKTNRLWRSVSCRSGVDIGFIIFSFELELTFLWGKTLPGRLQELLEGTTLTGIAAVIGTAAMNITRDQQQQQRDTIEEGAAHTKAAPKQAPTATETTAVVTRLETLVMAAARQSQVTTGSVADGAQETIPRPAAPATTRTIETGDTDRDQAEPTTLSKWTISPKTSARKRYVSLLPRSTGYSLMDY